VEAETAVWRTRIAPGVEARHLEGPFSRWSVHSEGGALRKMVLIHVMVVPTTQGNLKPVSGMISKPIARGKGSYGQAAASAQRGGPLGGLSGNSRRADQAAVPAEQLTPRIIQASGVNPRRASGRHNSHHLLSSPFLG
jgi:hypothetical protein